MHLFNQQLSILSPNGPRVHARLCLTFLCNVIECPWTSKPLETHLIFCATKRKLVGLSRVADGIEQKRKGQHRHLHDRTLSELPQYGRQKPYSHYSDHNGPDGSGIAQITCRHQPTESICTLWTHRHNMGFATSSLPNAAGLLPAS